MWTKQSLHIVMFRLLCAFMILMAQGDMLVAEAGAVPLCSEASISSEADVVEVDEYYRTATRKFICADVLHLPFSFLWSEGCDSCLFAEEEPQSIYASFPVLRRSIHTVYCVYLI